MGKCTRLSQVEVRVAANKYLVGTRLTHKVLSSRVRTYFFECISQKCVLPLDDFFHHLIQCVFDNSISADFTQNFDYVPWQKTFHTFGYLRFFAKAYSLHFAQNRLKANYRTHPSHINRLPLMFEDATLIKKGVLCMNLLIVDDDNLIRKSLEISLKREDGITVIGTASDGAAAVDACSKLEIDVILMDIRMPGMDGIAATKLIKSRYPNISIMMLTTFDDRPNIQQALVSGASGYLLKTDKVSGIANALRTIVAGTSVIDANVLKKLTPQPNPALDTLTPREMDITKLVAQGLTNKEIAQDLFLSEGTVRNNIVIIMEKLAVTNRTQLALCFG